MRSSFFWDVTQRRLVVTDVSGKPIGARLKGKAVQEQCLGPEKGAASLPVSVGN